MKKSYISPEIDFIKIKLGTDICSSLSSSSNAETPIDDVIVIDPDDDL